MDFLRRLFGPKKPAAPPPPKAKKKWRFSAAKPKPRRPDPRSDLSSQSSSSSALDANKHAIAVAAATAAVAEAALAAAHAAAEVVRLTNGGAHVSSSRSRYFAAVRIQSTFRGYLARRALRALKALVKLQALARGHIVRKQTSDMLRRMQTLVRVQARARATRTTGSESLHSRSKKSLPHYSFTDRTGHQRSARAAKSDGPSVLKRCGSNANFRDVFTSEKTKTGSNWLDHWMEETVQNDFRTSSTRYRSSDHDEKSDKILEVDTWRPRLAPQRSTRRAPISPAATHSIETLSMSHLNYPTEKDEIALSSGNSPQPFSAASSRLGSSSSRRGPFTPARSDRSLGFFSAYSSHPNYMANTESSRAKVRSQSAPRQRIELEKFSASRRSAQGCYWDGWTHSDSQMAQDAYAFNHIDRYGNASLR